MKLKNSFITHEVANEHITVSTSNTEFAGLIRSNKTAAFIIESLKEDTTPEKIAESICENYEAQFEIVLQDVLGVINSLKEIGAIDE